MLKKAPYIIVFILLIWQTVLYAQQRFPKPEFESGYEYPEYQLTNPRSQAWEYIDVFVLLLVLSATTYFTLKRRSRTAILWTSVFTLIYFGFIREGCICSIGSIQNIALALFNEGYALPLSALLFFIIPLVFAMFYGRQFCAGACPLGAVQELTGLFPIKIPKSIENILSAIPYLYLSLAVLFAATDSQFIICKYDPYVGIFRLDAPATMLIFAGLLIVSGLFINRPYCRFFCPYGVLLNWFSRFSNKHLTITPDECINCKLCENSCPYNAILPSTTDAPKESIDKSRKRYIIYILLIPVFALAFSFLALRFSSDLATVHRDVRLAREIRKEMDYGITALSQRAITFKESGETVNELFGKESYILQRYRKGTPWIGVFLGLSLGIALLSLSIRRERVEYLPHKGKCFSCGKCFNYCPVHIEKSTKK